VCDTSVPDPESQGQDLSDHATKMTRTVHPSPLVNNDSSGSTSEAPAKAFSHSYEAMAVVRQVGAAVHLPAHAVVPSVPLAGAPSVPISVTTASHPDPIRLSSSHQVNLQLATGGMPEKQFHLPAVKLNYNPPPLLAGPKRGFTLPPDVVSSPDTFIAPTHAIKKSTSAMPLMQGYSAASIASIQAQDVKNPNALGRRTHSAPNTVILAKDKSKSKFKYRKQHRK